MPLPGFNPIELAPPPGTTEIAASAAQAARLHQRISDLERRLSTVETGRGTAWTALTGVTYANNWSGYGGSFGPYYRIEGRTVTLSGLLKPTTTTTGAQVLTLPTFLRPEPYPGVTAERYFALAGNNGAYVTVYVYLFPSTHAVSPGAMFTANFGGATSTMWFSLDGISYLKRADM